LYFRQVGFQADLDLIIKKTGDFQERLLFAVSEMSEVLVPASGQLWVGL
jgi:hypothetical protein